MKPEPYTLRVTDAEPPAPPFAPGDLVKVAAIGFEHSGSCGLVIQQHQAEYLLRFRRAECQWYAERDLALLSRDPQPLRPFAPGDKVVIAEPGSPYLGNKARITAAATRDPENLEDMGGGFLLTLRGGHFWAKPHHLVRYRNCGKVLAAIADAIDGPEPVLQVGDLVRADLPGAKHHGQTGYVSHLPPGTTIANVHFPDGIEFAYPLSALVSPPFKPGDVVQVHIPGDRLDGWYGTVQQTIANPPLCWVDFAGEGHWIPPTGLVQSTQHELDAHASDDGPAYPYGEPDGPFDEPSDPPVPLSFKIFDQVLIENPRNLLHGERGVVVGTQPSGLVMLKDSADGEILTVSPDALRHLTIEEFLAGPPREDDPEEGEL